MSTKKKRKWCRDCKKYVLAEKIYEVPFLSNLVGTVATLGFYAPIWAAKTIKRDTQPFRCPTCGRSCGH